MKKGRKVSKSKKPGKVTKRLGKKPKPKCFAAGTKISTKDGFKNIEHIKAGDYVWSENPETHEKALKKVKKIFVREKDSIVRLSINGEAIRTTAEHPFYVEGQGFTEAKALNIGDKVRLKSGEAAEVTGIEEEHLKAPIKVYNFEVEDLHTYYVSEQQVLVHNTCGKVTAKKAKTSKPSSGKVPTTEVLDVHGNSKLSTKPQHGYEIYDIETNDVVKTGISGQSLNKNGTSPRANSQVNKWNKNEGAIVFSAKIIIKGMENRRAALDWEIQNSNKLWEEGNSMNRHRAPRPWEKWK